MTDHVLTVIEDRILKITFNRPEKKNALTHAMYDAAATAMREAADNDAAVPEDVEVWQQFEDKDAQTLVDYILDLKRLLVEVRDKVIFSTKFSE